jgi:hypothetical protein
MKRKDDSSISQEEPQDLYSNMPEDDLENDVVTKSNCRLLAN